MNLVVSILISALMTIFLLARNYDGTDTVYRIFQSLIFTNLVSFGNMFLLFTWNLKFRKKERKLPTLSLYLYSYVWAMGVWFLVVTLYSAATGKEWEGEQVEEGTVIAYLLAIVAVFSINTIILIIQYLFIFQYRNAQNEIEKLQLKANVSETMNLLLRQQIQPHFLFNALNTAKSLYKQDTKLGEEYLIHLSNFLRVSVSNPKEHLALVRSEIDFCLIYLRMQKIRFGTAVEYDIQLSDPVLNNGNIPYFSLQPLIENVLKHNELTEERPVHIRIYEENGFIAVRNNLQVNPNPEGSTGNGLYNLRERYRLLGESDIRISSDDSFFTVYLKILKR